MWIRHQGKFRLGAKKAAMRTNAGINLSINRELSLGYDLEKPVGKGQDGIAMNNN